MAQISFQNVDFYYEADYPILKNFSYSFQSHQMIAIVGPSGSGKTSLLHLISQWISPISGQIIESGLQTQTEKFRYVFSSPFLIAELTILDNLFLDRKKTPQLMAKCHELASFFDVTHLLPLFPAQLSSGQQQRMSVIRALLSDAPFFLADEPTAHLDPHRALSLMQRVIESLRNQKQGMICVTHDPQLIKLFDIQLNLSELLQNETASHD